jgi:catechol 2,3-dioxygenase-like lactoylglutathione lyase family enzyme
MKLKSISGVVCYVSDIDKTAEFYEALGFRFGKRDANNLTAYVNWFWIEFHAGGKQAKQESLDAASGQLVFVGVENADEAYEELVSKGMKPQSEPHDAPEGRREFVICDPDGYKIALFQKK